jgi:hypothetical protein
MFLMKPRNVMEMRAMIIQLCNDTDEGMCRRVITNHTEQVIAWIKKVCPSS